MAQATTGGGAAKHWTWQRLTAVLQVPLAIWFTVSMIAIAGADRAAFMAFVANPINTALLILMVLSVFYHMRLGIADLIEDYIHEDSARSRLETVNSLLALTLGVVAIFSIISITLIV